MGEPPKHFGESDASRNRWTSSGKNWNVLDLTDHGQYVESHSNIVFVCSPCEWPKQFCNENSEASTQTTVEGTLGIANINAGISSWVYSANHPNNIKI